MHVCDHDKSLIRTSTFCKTLVDATEAASGFDKRSLSLLRLHQASRLESSKIKVKLYSPAMKRHGSNISSSSITSRETHKIHRFARRLARLFNACTRKSSHPSNISTQPNAEDEKRSSLAKGFAGDAPKGNTDISQQGTEHASNRCGNKPRGTPLETLMESKEDFLLCRYCGQSSRVGDVIDRVATLRRRTRKGIPPSRTLTPVRCRTCYSAMPVSPLVRPKTAVETHQEEELIARGKMKFIHPTIKPSTIKRTLKVLREEKDENKKRKLSTMHYVDRDVLLVKLQMRRAVLSEG